MRPFAVIQLGNIIMLLVQSLLAPMLIGVDSFGLQMLMISPALLAQSLIEPAYQNLFNHDTSKLNLRLSDFAIIAVVFTGFVALLSIGNAAFLNWPVFVLFFAQYTFTVMIAYHYAAEGHYTLAYATIALLSGYVLGYATFYLVAPHYSIIAGNIVGFSAANLFLMTRNRLAISQKGIGLFVDMRSAAAGLTFRLPAMTFATGFIIILGLMGSSAQAIGTFRITFAAVNAGRYLNIVPPAALQVRIKQLIADEYKLTRDPIIRKYGAFMGLFAVAMAVLFPSFYAIVFGLPFEMPRIALFAVCFYLLLQPLCYAMMVQRGDQLIVPITHLIISTALLLGFASMLAFIVNPLIALSISVVLAISAYLIILSTGKGSPQ